MRPVWQVLAELSALLGDETGIDSAAEALEAIAAEVPFYAGITADEIGGTGVRWQEREAAGGWPERAEPAQDRAAASAVGAPDDRAPERAGEAGALRLGTYRDLWADEVTERNAALRFLRPEQRVELAPADAERLGVCQGDEVEVRSNGAAVRARATIRERMRPGAAFLIEGDRRARTRTGSASGGAIEIAPIRPADTLEVLASGPPRPAGRGGGANDPGA